MSPVTRLEYIPQPWVIVYVNESMSFTLDTLRSYDESPMEFAQLMERTGYLDFSKRNCPHCGSLLELQCTYFSYFSPDMKFLILLDHSRVKDNCVLRCRTINCKRITHSIRDGSFFHHSNYSTLQQMKIICCFIDDLRVSRTSRLLNFSRTSLTSYYDNLRGEYLDELERNPIKFTSVGIFEVDEVQLKHVKSVDGGHIDKWIFGILERSTNRLLYIPVENRSADVLQSLIYTHIPASSLVFSDDWAAYRTIGRLGYRHYSVNHSTKEYSRDEEIDGQTVKVHINTLEGMNRVVRQRFANKSTRNMERLDLILGELMYRYSGRGLSYPFKATCQ